MVPDSGWLGQLSLGLTSRAVGNLIDARGGGGRGLIDVYWRPTTGAFNVADSSISVGVASSPSSSAPVIVSVVTPASVSMLLAARLQSSPGPGSRR